MTTDELDPGEAMLLSRLRRILDGQYVVVDADDPDAPSELCTVELEGPWRA